MLRNCLRRGDGSFTECDTGGDSFCFHFLFFVLLPYINSMYNTNLYQTKKKFRAFLSLNLRISVCVCCASGPVPDLPWMMKKGRTILTIAHLGKASRPKTSKLLVGVCTHVTEVVCSMLCTASNRKTCPRITCCKHCRDRAKLKPEAVERYGAQWLACRNCASSVVAFQMCQSMCVSTKSPAPSAWESLEPAV